MPEPFERILSAIYSDETAFAFSAAILVWFALAAVLTLLTPFSAGPRSMRFLTMTPSALASLGVLGTFTGILLGLLDFDVNSIDESIPGLLAGLKIAFTTSIVGLLAAIAFRLFSAVFRSEGTSSDEVSAAELLSVLLDIRDDTREAQSRSEDALEGLRRAIASDGDGSVVTQLQKLRTAVQDGQGDLIREFRDFAAHMAENNQKALIEALRDVIRDFNDKLTEQFGENFKELNAAVARLVDWQENHKTHLDALEARLDHAVGATETSRDALQEIAGHAAAIPPAMEQLAPAMTALGSETAVLEQHLAAIAELRDKAVSAFPVIEENLRRVTDDLTGSVSDAIERSKTALDEAQTRHDALAETQKGLIEATEQARTGLSEALATTLERMEQEAVEAFRRNSVTLAETAEASKAQILKAWEESAGRMNGQFEEFDKQMQQELTRALDLMGKNLASLSEKFVSDYTPLTDRLNKVLDIARRAS